MREAMEGLLAPTYREKALGRAEVRKIFNVPGATIAGCMVLDGKIVRSARARLVRDGRAVWEGKLATLKRFKDDAREVAPGYECGIGLENFNDVKPGDIIEAFEMEACCASSPRPSPRPCAARRPSKSSFSLRRRVRWSAGARALRVGGGGVLMVVGVLRLTLFLPENHSLKGKRQVLRAIKARVRNKFNVSIAESDGHDMWQRAELGICQVGSDRAFVDGALREVVNFIDSLGLAPLGEEQLEIINY